MGAGYSETNCPAKGRRWKVGSAKIRQGRISVTSPPRTFEPSTFEEEAIRALEIADDLVGEPGADVSVDEAVIEGEREQHHAADDDLAVFDDGFLFDAVDAEDRDLREVQ